MVVLPYLYDEGMSGTVAQLSRLVLHFMLVGKRQA